MIENNTNKKRLLCYSYLNNENCNYSQKCTYAHSLDEQIIDEDKISIYKIIFKSNLNNLSSNYFNNIEDIYKGLIFMSNICHSCKDNNCTGGYNCRNGACNSTIKICKSDLLTGECNINKIYEKEIDKTLISKIKEYDLANNIVENYSDKMIGCQNGYHLTENGLIPFYKYQHNKEDNKKKHYESVRHIDIGPYEKFFRYNYVNNTNDYFDTYTEYSSDSSCDEDLESYMREKYSDSYNL